MHIIGFFGKMVKKLPPILLLLPALLFSNPLQTAIDKASPYSTISPYQQQ